MLDVNIQSPCSFNCIYCYTSHGKVDRYNANFKITKLNDKEIETIIKQFGNLGGKSLFICSEGDPLFYPDKFIHFAQIAKTLNLKTVTYTNASSINKTIAKKLHDLGVNLVLKMESIDPKINDILLRHNDQYAYTDYKGAIIPKQIKTVINEYQSDIGKLAISSMITKLNLHSLIETRNWSYEEIGVSHFLKQLYFFGHAKSNFDQLSIRPDELLEFEKKLYNYDKEWGFYYPMDMADQYSYDIRRFLNNYLSIENFPARIFGHPRGGVYCSSESLSVKFNFNEGFRVSMKDHSGKINLKEYFKSIHSIIQENINK